MRINSHQFLQEGGESVPAADLAVNKELHKQTQLAHQSGPTQPMLTPIVINKLGRIEKVPLCLVNEAYI